MSIITLWHSQLIYIFQLVMPECYDTHPWSLYTTIKRLNDVGEVKFLLEYLSWQHIINLFRNKCACQTIQGDYADVDVNLHGLISVFLSWWQYKILRVINILTTRFILITVSLFMAAMQYEYNLLKRWWEICFWQLSINQSMRWHRCSGVGRLLDKAIDSLLSLLYFVVSTR